MSLDHRVADAIHGLRKLHSTDPAARTALHALKLTEFTLECFWRRPETENEPGPQTDSPAT